MSVQVTEAISTRRARRPGVVLAATFTVDPLAEPLGLLLTEAGLELDVAVAPYGQVFQELLDPSGLFAANRSGVNAVLVRFGDWVRDAAPGAGEHPGRRASLERNVHDLVAALRQAASANPAAFVVCVCPSAPADVATPDDRAFHTALETRLAQGIIGVPNLRLLSEGQIGITDLVAAHDPERDRLAHIPYQPLTFATLGRALGRLVHALKAPPHKVLVLDCDNTLWKGVVGEDGVQGIEISEAHRRLQAFAVAKKHAGMIVCLASKNVETDVLQVFQERTEMVLRLDDVVATRINWLPKSQNVRALAAELNLGLDSFVFVDDNPVECAEVAAACPGALVLNLPTDEDPTVFLRNIWPLDQIDFTEEDGQRTELYRQNLERERFARAVPSIADFVAGLDLSITIAPPSEEQMARVAQLTQRTNQFNFTTRRRTESELRRLEADGLECRAVEVRDRFGDYGLVGVMIFGVEPDALVIDTMLLSCRVLGRGVEHAMVRALGKLAAERELGHVVAPFQTTKKNLPARQFLDSVEAATREEAVGCIRYRLSTAHAAALTYSPGALVSLPAADEGPVVAKSDAAGGDTSKSARWNRIARELASPERILAWTEKSARRTRTLSGEALAPRTDLERRLAVIWAAALGVPEVGVRDDYFELGGSSLLAATIFARIERELGRRLPLAVLLEAPTIEALAARMEQKVISPALVTLQEGGDLPPLFLVHDADGETLLYRNLARWLGGRRPVYGVQPLAGDHTSMVHTRIEQMAAHYVAEIRRVQPRGPYLLGGLCAGGIVAFEMALQLEAANQEARLVAVLDAADVDAPMKPRLETGRRIQRLKEALRSKSLGALPRTLGDKGWGFLSYKIDHLSRRSRERLAVAALERCLEWGWPIPRWARHLSVRTVYTQAEARYRPRGQVRGEIVLFRATSGDGRDEPYRQIYADPLLGWKQRCAGGVRAFDVPGGHGTMLQEPHVAELAALLRSYLGDDVVAAGAVAPRVSETGVPVG